MTAVNLNHCMYIVSVLLQSHTPKTEDQVEEDEKVMEELGTDARAAKLRARLMSASLLSDMESFKVVSQVILMN